MRKLRPPSHRRTMKPPAIFITAFIAIHPLLLILAYLFK